MPKLQPASASCSRFLFCCNWNRVVESCVTTRVAMRFARQLCVPFVQGRGSFGAVYLCIDKREGRKCVGSSPTSPGRTGHAEPVDTDHPLAAHALHSGTHGTCACAGAESRHSRAGLVPAAVPRRYGSSTGLAQLSEACRCVMKKLPFAPNLEARAACLLSIDSRACEVLSSVARCGGVLLCCNSTGSRFGGGQPPLTADWQQTDNQPTVAHHTLPHLCRAAPQCSHTAFRLQHSCTRIASAAGAAVALQRCAK